PVAIGPPSKLATVRVPSGKVTASVRTRPTCRPRVTRRQREDRRRDVEDGRPLDPRPAPDVPAVQVEDAVDAMGPFAHASQVARHARIVVQLSQGEAGSGRALSEGLSYMAA